MYEPHPGCRPPEDSEAPLWRYLDFTKLVALVATRALHFATAERMADPLEGLRPGASDEGWAAAAAVPVSSWHLNDHESAAMWRLHLKSDEGVAVQTTFQRLCDAVRPAEVPIHVGMVDYIDFTQLRDPGRDPIEALLRKDKSFEHEREVRALARLGGAEAEKARRHGGIDVPVDLDALVPRVVVSPGAPDWFAGLVRSVAERYEFDPGRIVCSTLPGRAVW